MHGYESRNSNSNAIENFVAAQRPQNVTKELPKQL